MIVLRDCLTFERMNILTGWHEVVDDYEENDVVEDDAL